MANKTIVGKHGNLGEARSMYTQTNALIHKTRATAVHKESLAFMAPELITEEISIASEATDELKNFKKNFLKHSLQHYIQISLIYFKMI